ncbi:FlxA-like family protein [Lacrimispora sp. BS-2]|uniref:FlxA-like family protein n=1 Tax=Lacrimispora sp. BS-2 TaxID=3151850 RepID=A0AAU7PR89_9FIRM
MTVTNITSGYSANYGQVQKINSGNQDSRLKSIQDQIDEVQKQLQSLSNNEKISVEQKMTRQKELQQQLQDLNKQLSQRKVEIQQEKREKATAKVNKQETVSPNMDKQDFQMVGADFMQSMVRADTSIKQANVTQSVKNGMEGRAGVLEREIITDRGRGSTEKKEAELAKVNEHIKDASYNMLKRASDINTTLEKTKEKETKAEENEQGTEEVNHGVFIEEANGEKPLDNTNSMYLQSSEYQVKGQYIDVRR